MAHDRLAAYLAGIDPDYAQYAGACIAAEFNKKEELVHLPDSVPGIPKGALLRIKAAAAAAQPPAAQPGAMSAQAGGAAAGAAAPPSRAPLKGPPPGSVQPIKERMPDGSHRTIGTLGIISPDGLSLTSWHVVVWEDGFIHPLRLWVYHDEVEIRHLGSSADLDVTALQLHAPAHWGPGGPSAPPGTTEVQAQEPSGVASSRSGNGGGSEASRSSNSSAGAFKWPYMDTARESLRPGEAVRMYGYAQADELEGLLAPNQPVQVHGKFSHYDKPLKFGVCDYQGRPNMSGGPVLSATGELHGTHFSSISHSVLGKPGGDAQPTPGAGPGQLQREEIVCMDQPAAAGAPEDLPGGGEQPDQKRATVQQVATDVKDLQQRVGMVEQEAQHKGQLAMFTSVWATLQRLQEAGIVPPSWEERAVVAAAKAAVSGARKRRKAGQVP